MHFSHARVAAGGAALVASAALALTAVPAANAHQTGHRGTGTVRAHLDPLNNSGATGHAMVRTHYRHLFIDVEARGLAAGLPHAQHIHYGAEARHECPVVSKDDTNGDIRLSTPEGIPAYGGIAVSLTTRGDTSPASALAIDRFPTAPNGYESYERRTTTSGKVARAIRRGEGVVVIHGVDYNGNGEYDFDSAGKSELDPTLPAEATDPAVCGVLETPRHH